MTSTRQVSDVEAASPYPANEARPLIRAHKPSPPSHSATQSQNLPPKLPPHPNNPYTTSQTTARPQHHTTMSREQYTPPTLTQGGASTSGGAGASSSQGASQGAGLGTFNVTGASSYDTSRPVTYICSDCDSKVQLKQGDAIRCKECGYRVLYKQRTNR